MKPYAQRYEDFTKATVKLAEKIHAANKDMLNVKYTLPEITIALRNIYKNPIYHNTFVGSKMEDKKWFKLTSAETSEELGTNAKYGI